MPVAQLSDIELRDRVVVASARERAATSHLVALLAEFDRLDRPEEEVIGVG